MTEDKVLTLKNNNLPLMLALVGSVMLAACSSKPSPWSESASPWDNRAQDYPEEQPVENADASMEAVEPMAMEGEAIEPVGIVAMEEEMAPAVESEGVMMAEEPMMMQEEPMPVVEETQPVMAQGGLAAQPANYFAVQVVASSTMEQLNTFANQNQLSNEWVAETTVNGKVWYVLMLGVYPSKSEAEQALAGVQGLPTEPWVRSVGSVQAVMN